MTINESEMTLLRNALYLSTNILHHKHHPLSGPILIILIKKKLADLYIGPCNDTSRLQRL